MRNAKKITAIAVIAAMLLSFMSFGAFAAGEQLTATLERVNPDAVIRPGDSFDVKVKVSGGSGETAVSALVLSVNIPESIFESVKPSSNFTAIPGKTYTATEGDACYGALENIFEMGTDSIAQTLNVSEANPVMILTLKVKSDATVGSVTLQFGDCGAMNPTTFDAVTVTGSDLLIPIKQKMNVTGVATALDHPTITKPVGTELSALGLDSAIAVTSVASGEVPTGATVPLDWTKSGYVSTKVGEQVLKPELVGDTDTTVTGVPAESIPSVTVTLEKIPAAQATVETVAPVEVAVGDLTGDVEGAAILDLVTLPETLLVSAVGVEDKPANVTWSVPADAKFVKEAEADPAKDIVTATATLGDSDYVVSTGMTATTTITLVRWKPTTEGSKAFDTAYKALTITDFESVSETGLTAEEAAAVKTAYEAYDKADDAAKKDIEAGYKPEKLDALKKLYDVFVNTATVSFGSTNRVGKVLKATVAGIPEGVKDAVLAITIGGTDYTLTPNDAKTEWTAADKLQADHKDKKIEGTLTYTVEGKTVTVAVNDVVKAKAVSGGSGGGWNDYPNLDGSTDKPSNPDDPTNPDNPTNPDDPTTPDTPADGFVDMDGFEWADEAVNALAKAGIVNGVGGNRFDPNGNVKREEFAKMVVGVFGIEPSNASVSFQDVAAGEWYAPFIAAAVEAGLVNGESSEYFGVELNITREDIATILARALKMSPTKEMTFADANQVSDYAKDAVALLSELGIVNGVGDNKFDPLAPATRAEAAKMIYGVMQLLDKDVDENTNDNTDANVDENSDENSDENADANVNDDKTDDDSDKNADDKAADDNADDSNADDKNADANADDTDAK